MTQNELDKGIKKKYPIIVACLSEYGVLAQLGEHLPYKQRVIGSSPIGPTRVPTKPALWGKGEVAKRWEPRGYERRHQRSELRRGEIAQLARARGSYPRCRGFKSPSRYYNLKWRKSSKIKGFRCFLFAGTPLKRCTKSVPNP